MFYQLLPDTASGETDGCTLDSTKNDENNALPDVRNLDTSHSQSAHEIEQCELDTDQDSDVLRMAFIHLMTLKVIDATRNCSEELNNAKSKVRTDRD